MPNFPRRRANWWIRFGADTPSLLMSALEGAAWKYGFDHEAVRDGDEFNLLAACG